MIVVLTAECKFRQKYTCCKCGIIAVGMTIRKSYAGTSAAALTSILDSVQLTSGAMPIGWMSTPQGFVCDSGRHSKEIRSE